MAKVDRVRPVTQTGPGTGSGRGVDPRDRGRARHYPQAALRAGQLATLATASTALSEDIPVYDPVAMLETVSGPATPGDDVANPEIDGAEVEGEVQTKSAALPLMLVPAPGNRRDRQAAAEFARATVENLFGEGGTANASIGPDIPADGSAGVALTALRGSFEQSARACEPWTQTGFAGIAENITAMPETKEADEGLDRADPSVWSAWRMGSLVGIR